MRFYEYSVQCNTYSDKELEEWLDNAGEQGWELCSIKPITTTFILPKTQYIFKREIPEAVETNMIGKHL